MRRVRLWAITILGCVLVAAGAAAGVATGSTSRKPADAGEAFMLKHNLYPACAKLGRGVANALTGWVEVPVNMQKYYLPNDTGPSLFTGAAVGVVKGVIRTAVGVYETATFFVPYPEEFAPVLPPLEYPRFYTPPETVSTGTPVPPR